MATTVIDCGYVNPGGNIGLEKLVHTGQGRLLGFLISNAQTSAKTITFYDATSASAGDELLAIAVPAGVQPYYFMLPRHQALKFETGLYIEPNNTEVAIWAVLHS